MALENETSEIGVQSVTKLIDTCDSYIPSPQRDIDSPFLLPIEKSIAVPGKCKLYLNYLIKISS